MIHKSRKIFDTYFFGFLLGHVDPSLAEKYRMLEKAILVDQLNSKISHRPGPLELIEKNILHTNEPIEKIVKEGLLPFKVSEDELADKNFLSFEDDSQSSESDLFQANASLLHPEIMFKKEPEDMRINEVQGTHIFETLPSSSTGNIINISLVPSNSNLLAPLSAPLSLGTFKILNTTVDKNEISTTINIPKPPPPPKLELITYHVKPVKGLINTQNFLPIQITETPINTTILSTPNLLPAPSLLPVQNIVNQHVSSFIQNNQNQKYSAPGKDKNRKKCKNKAVSKRAIKFHEYKGPTNKNSSSSSTVAVSSANCKKIGETNFDLIMQQQCLLEYLENIYKNPHAKSENDSLKHPTKTMKIESDFSPEDLSEKSAKTFNKPHVTIFPSKPQSVASVSEVMKDMTVSDVGKLAKMKVSELKAYLKRINLPVSGPKPLLIERLKPYLPLKPLENNNDDCSETSVSMSDGNDFYNSSLHSVSSTESEMDGSIDAQFSLVSSSSKDEDIVAEQQRKIEELQRKLQQSQHELEQIKQHKIVDVPCQPKVVFDAQFQMPAVFLVDVQPTDDHSEKSAMLLDATSSQLSHNDIKITAEILSPKDDEPTSSNQIDKELNPALPMSQEQDISDVLEILLKNGEWPEISDGTFNQNSNESDNFIENVLSGQVNVMSPMLQEESINKILGEFETSLV